MSTHVEFWFDPICPFCWMTSRWIVDIAPDRDLEIDWRPISLLFKNDTQPDSPFHEHVVRTRDLLRVVESVRSAGHGDRIGALYTEYGRHIHHEGNDQFDVGAALEAVGLDPAHAAALTDSAWDGAIKAAMADGLELAGNDVGTPIIAVTGRHGRVGLFGPVITEFPGPDDRLRLWDGFIAMADTPGFFELKRTRTSSPDMSTIHLH
ncbi:MAG: DSBA-like thioredoxin [Ilumatobacteraceae bacterium]|nr:DSBA-like thioredoxin [Ilumatobacteraceae bacterium]